MHFTQRCRLPQAQAVTVESCPGAGRETSCLPRGGWMGCVRDEAAGGDTPSPGTVRPAPPPTPPPRGHIEWGHRQGSPRRGGLGRSAGLQAGRGKDTRQGGASRCNVLHHPSATSLCCIRPFEHCQGGFSHYSALSTRRTCCIPAGTLDTCAPPPPPPPPCRLAVEGVAGPGSHARKGRRVPTEHPYRGRSKKRSIRLPPVRARSTTSRTLGGAPGAVRDVPGVPVGV